MTQRQREVLQQIAAGQRSYGRKDVHDPADGGSFDALVEELQDLQAYGWVELHLLANHMTSHGRWYAAAAIITRAGRDALAVGAADTYAG